MSFINRNSTESHTPKEGGFARRSHGCPCKSN